MGNVVSLRRFSASFSRRLGFLQAKPNQAFFRLLPSVKCRFFLPRKISLWKSHFSSYPHTFYDSYYMGKNCPFWLCYFATFVSASCILVAEREREEEEEGIKGNPCLAPFPPPGKQLLAQRKWRRRKRRPPVLETGWNWKDIRHKNTWEMLVLLLFFKENGNKVRHITQQNLILF